MTTHLAGGHKPGKPLVGRHGGAVLCGGEQLHYAGEADTARVGELQCCVSASAVDSVRLATATKRWHDAATPRRREQAAGNNT